MNTSQGKDKSLNKGEFPSSIFVNREKQINRLKQYFNDASNGRGKFVVINGEEGTGKSTLVEYFRKNIVDKNTSFMKMRFYPDDGFDPYAPFTRLISELQQSDQIQQPTSNHTKENSISPDNGVVKDLNMEMLHNIQSNYTLIQQRILSTLFEYTSNKPLILFIENIHFASQSAWQFFHYLADKGREEKILIIATLRQDGREMLSEKKPIYSDILQRMNRDGFLHKITMERVDIDEMRIFLHGLFNKTDFSGDFISMLFDISGGILGQITKYLKNLYDSQKVYEANGIWFNKSDIDKEEIIQENLHTTNTEQIKEDFKQLSDEQQKLLKHAALMDGSFTHELLAATTNFSNIFTIKELRKILEKKYIIESDTDTYDFKKSELRAAILALIPGNQQQEVHKEIADIIEESLLFSKEEKANRLAHHYFKSNHPRKSIKYLVEAGDFSIQKLAFIEAKTFYQNAISLLSEENDIAENSDYSRLYVQSAWLNRILGNYDDTLEICEKAHRFFGNSERDRIANIIRIHKGLTYFRLYNWMRAKENLEVCLKNIDIMEPFEKATIYFAIGNIHFEFGEYSQARENYTSAQKIASEIEASSLIALIYNHLGTVENITGNPMLAIALYSKAIPLYETAGHNSGLAQVYHNIGITYADEQNWEEANKFCGKSLSVSGMMGLTPLKAITFLNRALALTQLNRLNEAQEYNFKAIRLLELLNDELGIAEYHKIQGMLYAKDFNWEKSMHNFNLAIQRFKMFENKLGYAETLLEKGLTEINMENKEAALNSLNEANKVFTTLKAIKKAKYTENKISEINEQIILV